MHALILICALVAAVFAQVGPQATLLPQCIKNCDPGAISHVNCTNADQYCHCIRYAGILSNITQCADVNCTNPSSSLYTFTTLFNQICTTQYNLTVPILGSNSTSANKTNVTYTPTPGVVIIPHQGSAGGRLLDYRTGSLLLVGSLVATGLFFGSL